MANKILHATIMQKNTAGGKNIIYPKTITKNIIDGSSTLDQTLNTLKSSDISNKTVTFTQASTRENLVSGETLATSQGKIMKLISDLKSLAYIDIVGVSNLDSTLTTAYNNRVTTDKVTTSTSITSAGYVADARAVNNLQNQINTVNSNINGVLNAKTFASNVDDIFIGGCYGVNLSTQGTLPISGYALLFVRTANRTWIYQDLIYTDTINFKHYHRMNINNTGWTEWGKYTSNRDFDKYNLKYHAREIIRSGTITDFIVDKISNGYYGGDITTVGDFIPSDTFKGYGWGLIHWKKSGSNIAFLTYYPDRSTEIGYKSISPSENYDTGWITK